MAQERLQKILARAGVASRRKAEELILAGRVSVNRATITELGVKADVERDHIKVDGRPVRSAARPLYVLLNKPRNYVTTTDDPQGRPTVMHLIKGIRERLYPVGRLDFASEGALLLTNDGELAGRILAAKSRVQKTYLVKVNGSLAPEQETQFREGIPLEGRRTAPAGLKLIRRAQNPWYEVRLIEGRKNQIRLMFRHFGRLVEKLKRVRIGFLELGPLQAGEYRLLTPVEVRRLRALVGIKEHDDH